MFLLALTRQPIQNTFHTSKLMMDQVKIDSLLATIVTDDSFSHYLSDPSGFTIIESPNSDYLADVNVVNLIEIRFNKKDNGLSIYKPPISGRPIYYHQNAKGEFFCSTHISLLRNAGVSIEENADALPEFLRFVQPNRINWIVKRLVEG